MSDVMAEFLVNGRRGSAAGERAERIAARLGAGHAVVTYREGTRRRAVTSMITSLRRNRPTVVYAMDLAVAPICAWALSSPRSPLVVDTGDTPVHFLNLIGASRRAKLAASVLESVGYGRSGRIVVRGRYHADQLLAAGHAHVTVIPDGVDLQTFRAHDVSHLRHRLGLGDVMTVGVQGNFTWYPELGGGIGWDLIEALARRPKLNIHAVFIGEGPGIAQLRVLAQARGVGDRMHVIGRVPYSELPYYLSLCDVTLLTQTDDPSSWARTTGKLPTYLATGRHVVASRVGTAADLLPEHHLVDYYGTWDHSYPDRLADRLADLSADRKRTIAEGLALRSLAHDFDYDTVADDCAKVILESAGAQ